MFRSLCALNQLRRLLPSAAGKVFLIECVRDFGRGCGTPWEKRGVGILSLPGDSGLPWDPSWRSACIYAAAKR